MAAPDVDWASEMKDVYIMRKSLIEARRKHDKYLRKMGVHPDQLKKKKRDRRSVAQPGSASGLGPEGQKFKSSHSDHPPSFAPCPRKEPNVYSGERKLLGIACMHKSNLVPVFEKKDLVEIGKMRR